jgi:hypothetical protein
MQWNHWMRGGELESSRHSPNTWPNTSIATPTGCSTQWQRWAEWCDGDPNLLAPRVDGRVEAIATLE